LLSLSRVATKSVRVPDVKAKTSSMLRTTTISYGCR
jgi:hypothetical protein